MSPHRRAPWAAALALGTALASGVVGCRCDDEAAAASVAEATEEELATARERAQRLFEASGAEDCAALAELIPRLGEPEACAQHLQEWNDELRMSLLAVEQVARDGRQPGAFIVRTRVMRRGQERSLLVRVLRTDEGWVIAL